MIYQCLKFYAKEKCARCWYAPGADKPRYTVCYRKNSIKLKCADNEYSTRLIKANQKIGEIAISTWNQKPCHPGYRTPLFPRKQAYLLPDPPRFCSQVVLPSKLELDPDALPGADVCDYTARPEAMPRQRPLPERAMRSLRVRRSLAISMVCCCC